MADLDLNKKIAIIVTGVVLLLTATVVFYRVLSGGAGAKPAARVPAQPPRAESIAKPKPKPSEEAVIKSSEAVILENPESAKAEDAYRRLAAVYERRQDLLKLKHIYQELIEKFPASDQIANAQKRLEETNVKLLFSDIPTYDSFVYVVQKGDSLVKIAKKFNTTVELISRANSLGGGVLRYGKKLKIPKHRFSIVVNKSQNLLMLKADGNLFKTYDVATGKNSSTPVGTFTITSKIVDPPWYPPAGKVIPPGDPRNVLGSRWMGISKPSYGIHGTIDPQSIGKSVTEGCVRLKNSDVEELYAMVPEGTEVVIVD